MVHPLVWNLLPGTGTVPGQPSVLKFVNEWHGSYLRSGNNVITGSVSKTIERHKPYAENDEVDKLNTKALKVVEFPVVFKNASGTKMFYGVKQLIQKNAPAP